MKAPAISTLTYRRISSIGIKRSATQAVADTTDVAISFVDIRWDDLGGGTWAIGQPTQVFMKSEGLYLITGFVGFASTSVGYLETKFRINGGAFTAKSRVGNVADLSFLETSMLWKAAANDYVEMYVLQTSGASINMNFAELTMARLA